jgi:ATP-dependent protease ClpP protease subunit
MTMNGKPENRYWGKITPRDKAEILNAVTTPAPSGNETVATIRLYGPIDSWGGWWGISTRDVGEVLDHLPDSVTQIILRINSPGGEVFEGVSILNMLRAHKATVTAVVDGLAASAASVIAAGCDETVMSPGTQMMIHSPWMITWGSAAELRKSAEMLDGVEASIVEIYEAKAGEKDWATLLAEDTWLTASATVEMGLADRVAVIPDAGETETVGSDNVDDDSDGDGVENHAVLRPAALRPGRIAAAASKLPSSSEPGDPNRKEEAVAYSDLTAGLRERLGVTDAEASDETLLAALDQALEEQAEAPNPTAALPKGVTVIDSSVLADLQAQAALGAEARQEQTQARRDGILATALADGRISSASRDQWAALLADNEEGTTALLASLPKNTVPVSEIGHAGGVTDTEDALYNSVFAPKKEEVA